MQAKSFIKWVGGKAQILVDIRKKYPLSPLKYCEPFLGGGAVFFDVVSKFNFKEILLNDINEDLITAYCVVRDDVDNLISALSKLERDYLSLNLDDRKVFYYQKRAEFNALDRNSRDFLKIASLFIFLNKACFNGLYRVNSSGKFNVSVGSYEKPLICDEANLLAASRCLKNVILTSISYENCLDFIDADTFVYIDPPYRPISKTASFASYTKDGFDDEDQINLSKFVDHINEKGAKIVLSNSDPKNLCVNDNFFDDLYQKYSLQRIQAGRVINSNSASRGKVSEILVSNFL